MGSCGGELRWVGCDEVSGVDRKSAGDDTSQKFIYVNTYLQNCIAA